MYYGYTNYLIAVKTSFPKGTVLDMREMLLKVNSFADDRGKRLIWVVFIDAESIHFCMDAKFHKILLRIFSNDIFHSSLIKSFF